MQFSFYKMQSTGNDFVVADFNEIDSQIYQPKIIRKICDRNFGIGSDGFIAVEKVIDHAFQFHYYNNDGSRGEMCANGCRAAILFAKDNMWIKENTKFSFLADDGAHSGLFENAGQISLSLNFDNALKEWDLKPYNLPSWVEEGYFTDTGVPHFVLLCKPNVLEKNIHDIGTFLRFHKDFEPAGTNVNFVEIIKEKEIIVRTFERGVDGETLSCGTGITASAIIAKHISKSDCKEVSVTTLGGKLKVLFGENIVLSGASEIVFKGQIEV